ncbi:MAG: phage terminase large subunit [Clostridia bacterium]|nr:phage terminase large subunit [Clostridia bacterium]MBQ8836484.1 phage terminase large subunit [Clostridia bacterium]
MKLDFKIEPPNEKQKLFFLDQHKYVGYGGARGGGKSWALRRKMAMMCLYYPGIKCGIYRRTYPELRNNHVVPLLRELHGIASFNESKKIFKFPNGSVIELCYADNQKDLGQKFQGQEFDILSIDEATQISEEWFAIMKATVRGVNSFPKRIYITCNPGGVGHSWVKRLFIDRSYKDSEDPSEYSFIQALPHDNKALMESDPDYIKSLASLPPKLRAAWLEGSWDIFMGQFFEEFIDDPQHYHDRRYTHVIEPFEIPPRFEIYRSFDWGYSKPFSCDWWAIDTEGRAYLCHQLYGCTGTPDEGIKWAPDKVFSEIARIEREHRWFKDRAIRGVADSAIWASDGGEAIIESADRHGVYFDKSDKTRVAGWMQMHYRLSFGDDGRPMMYFFNTCRHAIRTIPLMQYSQTLPEDLDTSLEDHFCDSCRYFCMTRPISARDAARKERPISDPLDQFERERRTIYNSYGAIRSEV